MGDHVSRRFDALRSMSPAARVHYEADHRRRLEDRWRAGIRADLDTNWKPVVFEASSASWTAAANAVIASKRPSFANALRKLGRRIFATKGD